MADTPTIPEIKTADVLMNTRHEVSQTTIDNAVGHAPAAGSVQEKIKKAREASEAAKKARTEHPEDFKAELSSITRPTRFTDSDLDGIKSKLSDTTGDRADLASEKLTKIIKYIEANRSAETKGTTISTELPGDFNDVRTAVVERLLNDGGFIAKFPEISAIPDPTAREAFVEELLARDPRLQAEITKELSQIMEEVKTKLKPDPKAEELSRAEKERDDVRDLQTEQIDIIKQELAARGIIDNDKIEAIIKTINTGDAGFAVSRTIDALTQTIPEHRNIARYIDRDSAIKKAEKDRADLVSRHTIEIGRTKNRNQTLIDSLTTQIGDLDAKIGATTTERDRIRDNYMTDLSVTEAEFNERAGKLGEALLILDSDNSLNRAITFATSNGQRLKEAEAKFSNLNNDTETATRKDQREKDKKELIERLEKVIPNAVGRFLEKKYEDALADQGIAMNAASKEAGKKGEKWLSDNTKTLKQRLDDWSSFDTASRERKFNKDNIATDIKNFAARASSGENPTRALVAEKIGYSLDATTEKNKIATEVNSAAADYAALTPQEKAQADAIFDKRKKDFDQLVADQGDNVKKKLIGDYFASRGFLDKQGFGQLNMTEDEWGTLNEQFGPMMEEALKKSEAAQGVLKNLEAKGIAPDKKLKWLLWLLLIMGVGALLTFGGVPIAVATGGAIGVVPAAVKAAGGAAVHGAI